MGAMMAENAGESLPKQMGAWSDLKGAYRFLNNDRVKPEQIGHGHRKLTLEALRGRPVVLLVQDDTEIHGAKGGGKMGGQGGEVLHSTLAVTPSGGLVGIVDQYWFKHVEPEKGETQNERADRWRESDVWAEAVERIAGMGSAGEVSRWIHVADRASDNLRFMHACVRAGHGFVVRAQHNRRVEDGTGKLWEHMAGEKKAGTLIAQVGMQRDKKTGRIVRRGRKAKLSVRYARVRLDSPKNHPGGIEPLEVRAVYLVEEKPPKGVEAVDWMLLTSEPVASYADACVIAAYYQGRWVIEEWHRVLKEGCSLEQSQLEEADALRCLSAIYSVVAVRMLQLRDLAQGSDQSDAAALRANVDEVWIMVVATLAQVNAAKLTPLEFWRKIAQKGGFIGRKSDGKPGWKVIWRGWYDVSQMVRFAHAARKIETRSKSCG